MATTYLTIGSRFQPYTLSEMLVPYQAYKDEYQRQEDLYNTYAETAGLIGADLNPELDSDILEKTYNPYMEALNSSASALSSQGLTPGGRRTLQELRRRFGREITPIKVASEARAKARENWDKMLAQDKTLMTNANPYYKGVSAYMNGASPDTTYVSGNELYSRGQNLAEAFSKTMREVPEDERLALQGQYFRIVSQYGADSAEADAFMQGAIDKIPALAEQVDGILANSGIDAEGFTSADKERARQYIIEGMKAGLSGETKVQYLQNREWDLARRSSGGTGKLPEAQRFWDFSGGIDSSKDKGVSQMFQDAEMMVPDGEGGFSTPELDRMRDSVEYSDEELAEAVETIQSFEKSWGRPETRATSDPEKFETVRVMPDGTLNKSRVPREQLKRYNDAVRAVNSTDGYNRRRQEFQKLIDNAKFYAGPGASEKEIQDSAKTYAHYRRNLLSIENRSIHDITQDASTVGNTLKTAIAAASSAFANDNYNAVSIVENGQARPLKKKEVDQFREMLSNDTGFTLASLSNVKDKDGNKSPYVFTYRGDSKNEPVNFIVNSNQMLRMNREYTNGTKFLTDFEPETLKGAPELYNPTMDDIRNEAKKVQISDSQTGYIWLDPGTNKYVKAIPITVYTTAGAYQDMIMETMDDLAYNNGSEYQRYVNTLATNFFTGFYGK